MNKGKYNCHDCHKTIKVMNGKIKNGLQLKYKEGDDEYMVFKCFDCYNKDKSLKNYKRAEVYSRIVGYLRPVQQWNPGKGQEFNERKPYKI